MAYNHTSTSFPYQHLAVLGMDKLKKYVPPENDAGTNGSDASSRRSDEARTRIKKR